MNNKGQSLVLFVFLIPIILIILCFIIDFSNAAYQKHKITSITKSIIATNIDNPSEEDIISLYHDNNIDYQNMIITIDDGISIKFKTSIKTVFATIIGINKYDLNINVYGYKEDNKLIYKKGN